LLSNKAIVDLLTRVMNGESFHDVMKSLGDPVFDEAVETAVSMGYLEGIRPTRVASGRLTVDTVYGTMKLTKYGEDYLTGNSL